MRRRASVLLLAFALGAGRAVGAAPGVRALEAAEDSSATRASSWLVLAQLGPALVARSAVGACSFLRRSNMPADRDEEQEDAEGRDDGRAQEEGSRARGHGRDAHKVGERACGMERERAIARARARPSPTRAREPAKARAAAREASTGAAARLRSVARAFAPAPRARGG